MVKINIIKNYHLWPQLGYNKDSDNYDRPTNKLHSCNVHYYLNCKHDRIKDEPLYIEMSFRNDDDPYDDDESRATIGFRQFYLEFDDNEELCEIHIRRHHRNNNKLLTLEQKFFAIDGMKNLIKYAEFLTK